ncbi:MAG: sugar-binding domain-containing protein [Anaerohalosphaeraceae bacterium]
MYKLILSWAIFCGICGAQGETRSQDKRVSLECTQMISLDGAGWLLSIDANNVGREQQWWLSPQPNAKPTNIPRTLQSVFHHYNGVAWYWRDINVLKNPHAGGRYLLRFWDVDYYADIWVNGTKVGSHEGLQCPFELDVTRAIKPGSSNRIAVRVIYPGSTPIDGFTLGQTAHGWSGSIPSGGIMDSVELVITPPVRIENIYVFPDPNTGTIAIEANIRNTGTSEVNGNLAFSVSAATGGGTLVTTQMQQRLAPGDTLVKTEIPITNPRLWDIDSPNLYLVTSRVAAEKSLSFDESSTRCGFKDFRFKNGYFRLNGRRIFLRSAHLGSEGPAGGVIPYTEAGIRSEFVSCKAMGFNMLRFLSRAPLRVQLDVADEIGILLYQESSASWMFEDSPNMGERFDRQLAAMIRRDRNHPCIAMWGLLNETGDGPVFQHAAKALPLLRSLDKTRPVILASGRFDAFSSYLNGLELWKPADGGALHPNLLYNPKPYGIYSVSIWPSKSISLNPGAGGEYSVVRWTAPSTGDYFVSAKFRGTGCYSTTDLHILRGSELLFKGFINVCGWGDKYEYSDRIKLAAGETIDIVVGWGGGLGAPQAGLAPWTDTTEVGCVIKSSNGTLYDLAADFSNSKNPNGAWSYGWLKAGSAPDITSFTAYAQCKTENTPCLGGISNPGSSEWESVLSDLHAYPRVPHREIEIERLRTVTWNDNPLFLAEYGVGSGINLPRMLRQYEAMGEESCSLAVALQGTYTSFMADWNKWKLGDEFGSPDDFFDKCTAKMGYLRKMGISALRSNPNIISYSVTGAHDPFALGEGIMTQFREHKLGTFDSMIDAFAPLRWCLFAEPVSIYSGQKVKLEAVIANEDVLKPGEYPAALEVLGPDNQKVFERELTVKIPGQGEAEVPFAIPVFAEDVKIDGPSGKYKLVVRLLKGAAAFGESAEFYVTNPSDMPAVKSEITLWGEDKKLAKWLSGHGIKTHPFVSGKRPGQNEAILVSGQPGGAGDAKAWRELAERIGSGSTVIFLSLDVFKKEGNALGWLPLANKGVMGAVSEYTFPQVYVRDEWVKKHPIFDGLPTGLMDYVFYREIIPDFRYIGQDMPDEAIAGAFRTSMGYLSELMLTEYKLGAGKFILNALRVRQALGQDPTAEYLLRNMLNYAAQGANKPLADLPDTFDKTLDEIGYK